MNTIGLLGDTHGDYRSTVRSLDKLHKRGIVSVMQLGDFGYWGDKRGQTAMDSLNERLRERSMVLYVTLGNHDDYDYYDALEVDPVDGWKHAREHILVAPRGHRWTWQGRSFVSLGGAPSVDRQWRLAEAANARLRGRPAPKSWWHQEALTDEDVQKVVDGGPADIMLTHDAPLGVRGVEELIRYNPFGFHRVDLEYAYEGRKRMYTAFMAVQPKVFVHGHYHFYNNETWNVPSAPMLRNIEFTSQMVCLGCNGQKHSEATLDLTTLEVLSLDDPRRV